MTQLTELLARMQAGDPQARDALIASTYSELQRWRMHGCAAAGAIRVWIRPAWCTVVAAVRAPESFEPRIAARSSPTLPDAFGDRQQRARAHRVEARRRAAPCSDLASRSRAAGLAPLRPSQRETCAFR